MKSTQQINYGLSFHGNSILYAKHHPKIPGVEFQFFDNERSLKGSLAIDIYHYTGKLNKNEYDLISTAALLVVVGLFIPSSIVIEWDSEAARYNEFIKILQILYDVRAYCAKIPLFSPTITIQPSNSKVGSGYSEKTPGYLRFPNNSIFSHVLLFSGGIDSTYSMLRLLEEGQKPLALFLGINTDTIDLEWKAAHKISADLGIELLRCDFQIEGFPKKGADPTLWPQFGQFPYYNSIPHGRDILSATIASIIAKRLNCLYVAFGQEKESREKVILYHGRKIFRHDIESYYGNKILNLWLNRCLDYKIQLVSPIESFTIEEIRLDMINNYPDILSATQSCFWERLCCKCVKCISLYLIQRATGINIVQFPINPLTDPNNLDLADAVNSKIPDNEIGYGAQIRNTIKKIIRSGKYGNEDYWIQRAIENLL